MGLSIRWKIITGLLICFTVLGSLFVSYKLFQVENNVRDKNQQEELEREQQEKEKLKQELLEQQEKERLEQEKKQQEQKKTQQQTKNSQQTNQKKAQQEKERQELEKIKKEQQLQKQQEKERQLKEQQEKARLEAEQKAKEQALKEQQEKERLEQEQKAQQEKETQQEKKIIDAIKGEPYCEKGEFGYLDFSKTEPYNCYEDIYDVKAVIKTCPSGYKLNAAGTICEKGENRPDVKGIEVPSCTSGGTLYQETTNGAYGCTIGFFYMDYKCPNGYKFVTERTPLGTYKGCEWQDPYKTTYVQKGCSKGTYNSSTGSCYYFTTSPLSYKYSCPSGYTLKGNKCYEN